MRITSLSQVKDRIVNAELYETEQFKINALRVLGKPTNNRESPAECSNYILSHYILILCDQISDYTT